MSSPALVSLLIGLVVLGIAMAWLLWWDRQQPPDDEINDPSEATFWDQQLSAVTTDFGLEATRAAAGKWAASATTILGILSTVAIVAGPGNLVEDVGGKEAKWAAALVLVAAGVAAVSTLLAGLAEQGTPVKARLTAGGLRARTRTRAEKARRQVFWSRLLTVVALLCIVTATGVAWLTALTKPASATPQHAVVVSNSGAVCGALSTNVNGEVALTIAGATAATPIPEYARIKLVDSCPE